MTAKQLPNSLQAPDGSYYACLTDGNGNLIDIEVDLGGVATAANQTTEINNLSNISTAQSNGTQQTKITDGTHIVAVKQGSQAAATSDQALVVAISPNTSNLTIPVSSTTLATASNQTNASQKTQIVDGSGNVVGTVGTSPNASLDTNVAAIGGSAIGPAALNVDGISGAQLVLPTASFNEVYNGSTWDRLGGTAANGVYTQGAVASGSADSGNPVKVGGRYNSAGLPTLTNGQRGDLQLTANSRLVTALSDGFGNFAQLASTGFDGNATNGINVLTSSYGLLFNGTTWDRQRNNIDSAALITLTTSSAGTFNSADQTNYNGRGLQLGINISATTAQTLQVTVQGKDIASGVYYTIGGGTTTANLDFAQVLPRTWRVQAVVSGVGSTLSATIGASVIL